MPEQEKKFVRRMATAFAECAEHSRVYGVCIKLQMEGVERGACEKEFSALNRCFRTALRKRSA